MMDINIWGMRYFSAEEIRKLFDLDQMAQALQDGFVAYDQAKNHLGERLVFNMGNGNSATVIGPGTLPTIPAYTFKVNSKFPAQDPALKGVVSLFDRKTGDLLAQLDSGEVTSIRTGLSAALASHCLAQETDQVCLIGVGRQNKVQLEFLMKFRHISKVTLYDPSKESVARLHNQFKDRLDIIDKKSVQEACFDQKMILMATWSKNPIIDLKDVLPDAHITTLGADEPQKVEVSKKLVNNAKLIVDDIPLNLRMGTPGNLGLPKDCIAGTIGTIYSAPEQLSTLKGKRTIYSPVGLAFQNIIIRQSG